MVKIWFLWFSSIGRWSCHHQIIGIIMASGHRTDSQELWDDHNLNTGCWFRTWILFFHILGIIIPTDELIFFRGVKTTNQKYWYHVFSMAHTCIDRYSMILSLPLSLCIFRCDIYIIICTYIYVRTYIHVYVYIYTHIDFSQFHFHKFVAVPWCHAAHGFQEGTVNLSFSLAGIAGFLFIQSYEALFVDGHSVISTTLVGSLVFF